MVKTPFLRTAIAAAILIAAAMPARAQTGDSSRVQQTDTAAMRRAAAERLGRDVSQQEVLELLRNSGMTRSQMRARLQQAGYDPSLADRYFDMVESGTTAQGNASSQFVQALERMGLASRLRRDSLAVDSVTIDEDTIPITSRIFGRSLFRGGRSQFDAVVTGPVDAGYRLGPGDEIQLVLTGDVELAHNLTISREGYLFIPDVGQVSVNGLTLAQLQDRLYERLSRFYSGISRSPDAATRFQVSLGALRTNQVFVIGEVERPGAIQISSVARVLNALYRAGGPNENGSFRYIQVWRGNSIIQTMDLYDYLLRGDSRADIRLEQNDRIFVPPVRTHVTIEGGVRRPGTFEMKDGEDLQDLLMFAGGIAARGNARRIQIDRILPLAERRPGETTTLVDVDLVALQGGAAEKLQDGDRVLVLALSDEERRRVWLMGDVHNPGLFEWSPGMTLWNVISRADGLMDEAYRGRAHVFRIDPQTGTRRLIDTNLNDGAGTPGDIALADRDSIVIYSRAELRNPETVTINGFVKQPDTYSLADGMTIQDLILRAGGFTHGAYTLEAELSRMPDPLQRSDTTAHVFTIALTSAPNGFVPADSIQWLPSADATPLRHGDHIFIRRAPGFEPIREVSINGEVNMPGQYVISSRGERFSDLIERAGGLTAQAHAQGIKLVRDSQVVAVELSSALTRRGSAADVVLQAGDSIIVPQYDPMVSVSGEVNFQAKVTYREGRDLEYYINQAGGYAPNADKSATSVAYQNGERAAVRKILGFRNAPEIEPGATIFVPAKPPSKQGTNWGEIVSRTFAGLSALLTVLIAIEQLKSN